MYSGCYRPCILFLKLKFSVFVLRNLLSFTKCYILYHQFSYEKQSKVGKMTEAMFSVKIGYWGIPSRKHSSWTAWATELTSSVNSLYLWNNLWDANFSNSLQHGNILRSNKSLFFYYFVVIAACVAWHMAKWEIEMKQGR